MKKITGITLLILSIFSCKKLDVLPVSILQDEAVFSSAAGVSAYMSSVYNFMPLEDSKYNANEGDGFNELQFIQAIHNMTGEGMNKNVNGMISNGAQREYWDKGYRTIRQANYLLQAMPAAARAAGLTETQINNWLGEAYFLRAYTYFALVKRYGGVPLILTVQNYPQESVEELRVPRAAEQEVYDVIASDCDKAYDLLGATSEQRGRANKYIAAGFKSRAMLFAGSIAKYNTRNLSDPKTGKRVLGIPSSEAIRYFKSCYAACKLVEAGGYQLYRPSANKVDNYRNLFLTATSSANREVIFAREYSLNNSAHSYDVMAMPLQLTSTDGTNSYICPTLDYVELFDGLPKNADGSLRTTDGSNKYVYYDNRFDLFKDAEPRLLATVVFPGMTFKGQEIDIRRGVFFGGITSGINKFPTPPFGTQTNYNNIAGLTNTIGTNQQGDPTVTVNGVQIKAAGKSGMFGSGGNAGTYSGFTIRKMVDETLFGSNLLIGRITTPWIDMRYAEILLNRAEADYELSLAGQSEIDYVQDAYTAINDIRDRAGAVLLSGKAALNDINIIRKERRKELGFENKIFWDMKRWRVFDTEVNNRQWYILCPFLVAANGKYIYDRRIDERGTRFTFNPLWYYENIPGSQINRNPNLIPNN